jgi:hypothetical protein
MTSVLALIILLVLVVIGVVAVVVQAEEAAIRRRQGQIQYRARIAEQEIDEIGLRAQRAILEEALRHRSVNGSGPGA